MKQKPWGFDVRDMDTKVRPQDDFFHYAGGTWLKKNPLPKAESRWGSFTKLRRDVDLQLHTLLKKTKEQKLRDFYRSGIDLGRRTTLGMKPLEPYLEQIAKIKTADDFVLLSARLDRIGVGSLWGVMVDQDMKDSERYVMYLAQSGLGLPDRDYYLKDDAESRRVRNAYREHLEEIFALMRRKSSKTDAKVVMEIETAIAKASMTKEDLRDVDKTYHPMTLAALARLAPGINWRRYFKTLGHVPKDLIVMQPQFIKAMERLLASLTIEEWKIYLTWHLVGSYASYLSPAFEAQNFAFYGTTMTGTKEMKPLWRRVLNVTNAHLGELLGREYVREYFPPAAKRRMDQLVTDLMRAYAARIKGLDWMSNATKKKALKKLKMMKRKIGYPGKWKSYKGLIVRPGEYAGNAMRSAEHEHTRQMKKLTKKVDRSEWLMYPQTVNAYCNFGTNDIAFPAGILQPPFFSLTADDAINYGSIGSVIGHEITHGFDDQGAKFDGLGNRKTWWTPKDRKLFEKKAKLVVKQFDAYKVADGVPVNGQLTLGENIADLGGISIAYDAYQLRLKKTGRKDIAGFTPEQRYFLGASLFERENTRPESAKTRALTDPHSPTIFRVNGPMSNLPEFYGAFNVTKKDALYRSPSDRAKVW